MELVELAAKLADLGWAVLFILVVVIATVGLARQWWVPGVYYRRIDQKLNQAEAENRKLSDALSRAQRRRRTDPRG